MKQEKILIIEDQEEVRENIEELLSLSNYLTVTAENGKEGIKKALAESPDLILCDIMMPEMDGYEVLYIISKNPKTSTIPFVFLTAKAEKSDFRKGMNMGADDYVTKPFDEMELLGAIERRLNKRKELLETKNIQELANVAQKQNNAIRFEDFDQTRVFRKKDIVYREGDFGTYAYKIKSGKVKTYGINSDGKELVFNILQEGDFLGEKSLIQDSPRTEFAQAMEDTELILIPRYDFQNLIFGSREISAQFIKLLSQNLTSKEHELMEMAYNTVRKRTADALMKLYETYKKEHDIVSFDLARSDLARMVGTATESVIRILSEFKKDGWISIDGSLITIKQSEKIKMVQY